ncbi:MAG: glycosyltransferase family 2 protein [Sandaracinaceae bacterium]
MSRVGVVLIGKNEGDRLVRSLASVCDGERPVVYVDSASTDGSCDAARRAGATVVELDMSIPFSAARARNAGWRRLLEIAPSVEHVQFIDGDCEVLDGWIDAAEETLDAHDEAVAVCGWRRERAPESSAFNRVCDVEWRSGPVGTVTCFGGDVMIRASALVATGGYDPSVIAAEDDELGVRLRRVTGGSLLRIDRDSTLHDAAMTKVSEWWRRAKRCGHGYAQVHHLHGAPPERYFETNLRRTVMWGALAPLGAAALSVPTMGLSWLALARYPAVAVRTAMSTRAKGFEWGHAIAWGVSCAAAPIPEALGVLKFHADRIRGRAPKIIEYKGGDAA